MLSGGRGTCEMTTRPTHGGVVLPPECHPRGRRNAWRLSRRVKLATGVRHPLSFRSSGGHGAVCTVVHTLFRPLVVAYTHGYRHHAHHGRARMAAGVRARRRTGAVGDGDDRPAAPQRARLGSEFTWQKHRPSIGGRRTRADRREAAQRHGCRTRRRPAILVARFGIPQHRARHEGRLT